MIGIAVLVLIIGLLAGAFSDGVPRLIVVAPGLGAVGLAMLVFPGPTDVSPQNPDDWFRAAPVLDRVVWVVSGLGGIAFGFYAFVL
jgi:hypothetical protein